MLCLPRPVKWRDSQGSHRRHARLSALTGTQAMTCVALSATSHRDHKCKLFLSAAELSRTHRMSPTDLRYVALKIDATVVVMKRSLSIRYSVFNLGKYLTSNVIQNKADVQNYSVLKASQGKVQYCYTCFFSFAKDALLKCCVDTFFWRPLHSSMKQTRKYYISVQGYWNLHLTIFKTNTINNTRTSQAVLVNPPETFCFSSWIIDLACWFMRGRKKTALVTKHNSLLSSNVGEGYAQNAN
jgi:hypothetical protein